MRTLGLAIVEQRKKAQTMKNDTNDLWKEYNQYSKKLVDRLGKTNNIVGEYAEHLAQKYTGGELLKSSNPSADIKAVDGKLYQNF